ncbi:MAG: hypothetical protein KY457_05335 [Actinobacteria bacterium]|nr:hypothetical protein [Actinomycetota bacterium]
MSDTSFPAPQALRATVDRGFELHETGDLDATLAHYDGVLAAAPTAGDPVTVESLFAARFDRAVVLTELGELEAAADAFATAARGLPAGDPDVAHEIAMAELNRGICLQLLDRHDEALTVYAAIVGRFPDAEDDPVLHEQVVKAMVNRAATLEVLGRRREAAGAVDDVLGHLADVADLWVDEQRALLRGIRDRALAPSEG